MKDHTMSEVAFILSGSDNAAQADKTEAFMARNADWTIQFTGILEKRGYSYNNAVSHWIEAVAAGFAAVPEDASDYRVMCKARKAIRSL
jgi:hypothetical protein